VTCEAKNEKNLATGLEKNHRAGREKSSTPSERKKNARSTKNRGGRPKKDRESEGGKRRNRRSGNAEVRPSRRDKEASVQKVGWHKSRDREKWKEADRNKGKRCNQGRLAGGARSKDERLDKV